MSSAQSQKTSFGLKTPLGLVDVGGVGDIVEDGCAFEHREKSAEDSFITAVTEKPFLIAARKWNVTMKTLKEPSGCLAGIVAKPIGASITRNPADDTIWGGGGLAFVGMGEGEIGIKGDGSIWMNGER
jgi:hypothetical protein